MANREIVRANPHLYEALDVLDEHLSNYGNDIKQADLHLPPYMKDFVAEEMEHCVSDARYYLENYHVIQTEDQGLKCLTPFWESQEIFYYEIVSIQREGRPVKVLVLKSRQQGISEIGQALVFHKTIFTETCRSLVIAQDPGQTEFIFSKSRNAYECLPWWMRPERRYDAKGRYMEFDKNDEQERLHHPGLKSSMICEAANKLSGSPARGKTIRACHFSEMSSWGNGGILAKSIFPSMNASDQLAIMESTALGRQGFFFKFWKEVAKGRHDEWTPIFIPVYRTLKKYSKELKVGYVLTPPLTKEEEAIKRKALKKDGVVLTDEHFNWRRAKIRQFIDLTGSEWAYYGEYPNTADEAFQGTGQSAFPRKLLHEIQERDCDHPRRYGEITYVGEGQGPQQKYKLHLTEVHHEDDIPEQERAGTRLHIWEMPDPEYSYYLGVDVSEGLDDDADYSCIQVLKIGAGQEPDTQVAQWRGYENPTPLGDIVTALAYMYNSAQVAIECNGVGISTNNQLWRINEYENVYQWKHIDKVKNFITNTIGWYTNSKTRDILITKTREAIMEKTMVLRSSGLVEEMLDFAKEEGSSRYEGQESHDDMVFALMIARYCSHESDYGKQAAAQGTRKHAEIEAWLVFDPFGRKITPEAPAKQGEKIRAGWDYDEALALIQKKAGYSMRPLIEKSKVTWIVTDTEGKKVDEISDFDLARRMCLANKWSMRRSINRVDYQDTDYSPIHDKQGPQQRLYDQGVPAEAITSEMILHSEMAQGPPSEEDASGEWKNW